MCPLCIKQWSVRDLSRRHFVKMSMISFSNPHFAYELCTPDTCLHHLSHEMSLPRNVELSRVYDVQFSSSRIYIIFTRFVLCPFASDHSSFYYVPSCKFSSCFYNNMASYIFAKIYVLYPHPSSYESWQNFTHCLVQLIKFCPD